MSVKNESPALNTTGASKRRGHGRPGALLLRPLAHALVPVLSYLSHRTLHLLKLNPGCTQTAIIDGWIWTGFRCEGCGQLQDWHKVKKVSP